MKIGFDAKRAFFNTSGLGNYSRYCIQYLHQFYPNNEYYLYTPEENKKLFNTASEHLIIREPQKKIEKALKFYWRTFKLKDYILKDNLEVYHGLSNELPYHIQHTKIKSLVTIHDLIFIRYPKLYNPIDRKIYLKKFRASSKYADMIIAVSNQTKEDLINFFGVKANKIQVIYQGCNTIFHHTVSPEIKDDMRKKYALPSNYLLTVGTIEKRKNLLQIIKALELQKDPLPLVVVGRKTSYLNKVKDYIQKKNIKHIYFLNNIPTVALPAFYQMASIFLYPSLFEGFGIPILEALNSKVPIITSKDGCFMEAGGPSTYYVDPLNIEEISHAIQQISDNSELREKMIVEGFSYSKKFRENIIAKELMESYKSLL